KGLRPLGRGEGAAVVRLTEVHEQIPRARHSATAMMAAIPRRVATAAPACASGGGAALALRAVALPPMAAMRDQSALPARDSANSARPDAGAASLAAAVPSGRRARGIVLWLMAGILLAGVAGRVHVAGTTAYLWDEERDWI